MIGRILCLIEGHDIAGGVRLSHDREALVCRRCDRRVIRYDSYIARAGRERRWRYQPVDAWNIPTERIEPLTDDDLAALARVGIHLDNVHREDDCWPGPRPAPAPSIGRRRE